MTGDEVRQVFEAMLPQDEIDRLCQQCGVIERQRKLDLGMLVRAMVISAGTPGGAYQADVLRAYLECEVPRVTRAAFYRWFDAPLEPCMAALAERALAYARAQEVDLPGPLERGEGLVHRGFHDGDGPRRADRGRSGDWRLTRRSTSIQSSPSAAVPQCAYHCSPAREHDRRHLTIDESWRGCGLLADLGYAGLARLRACEAHDVRFVLRLKDTLETQGRLYRPWAGHPGVLPRHGPRCPHRGGDPRPRWPGH